MELDHIGVAVTSLEAAQGAYGALGLKAAARERVDSEGVEVAMLPLCGARVELLQPTTPTSPIARFLDRHGEGVHHVAIAVADIEASLESARQAGLQVIDDRPRRGAEGSLVAFLHPRSMHGVLVELVQRRTPA